MTNFDVNSILGSQEYQQELGVQRTFMARVYSWMTVGLLATALTALVVAATPGLAESIFTSGIIWALIIAEVVLVFGLSLAIRSLPVPVAVAMFIVYAVLNGASLSIILFAYTLSSVAATFFITAGMFAGMSAFGYATKRSLDGIGSFCIMGLWGLILASIVNLFIRSSAMEWLISFVGVIVFTGLTAYDTQKIKQAYATSTEGSAEYKKTALMGALMLYLDFINLFLYLLRFLGKSRD